MQPRKHEDPMTRKTRRTTPRRHREHGDAPVPFRRPPKRSCALRSAGFASFAFTGFLSVSESLWWFVFVTFVASWLHFRFGTHTVTAGLWFLQLSASRL